MKRLLIPSDFSNTTLDVIRSVADHFGDEKISILLFHAFELPDSDAHIMRYANSQQTQGLVTEDFRRECRRAMISKKNLKDIGIKYFYGSTPFAFSNFLEANDISAIVCPEHLPLRMLARNSIKPHRLIAKSRLPIITQFVAKKPKVSIEKYADMEAMSAMS